LALVALGVSATGGASQIVMLDQGAFQLSHQGRAVGTESFTIEQTGAGDDAKIVARGDIALERRRVSTQFDATPRMGFSLYRAEVSGDETLEVVVTRGLRLGVWVRTPAGIQDREVRLREGAILLDDEVAHLYFFGSAMTAGATLPVIVPRGNHQAQLQVLTSSPENLTVGGQSIEARRIRLAVDGVERQVWVDAEGRVLRVEIPSTGYLAERVRPPV
jgi:hypothetical protein